MNSESSNQEDRIEAVLKKFKDITVSENTISAFEHFLNDQLEFPGEVFCPEENEYYLLYEIEDSGEELYGILAKLKLVSDERRETVMPLCDLRAVDNRSKNYQLINDYSSWFINYQ